MYVWHKSSIIKGVVPRSGTDTDAKWGFSHTRVGYLVINYTRFQV